MKRILLIVAMLLFCAAPAMATVTVSATPSTYRDCVHVDVQYNCDAGEQVRAFALEITADNGWVISEIKDFNVGESNSVKPGYGIFPGRFRECPIDPADPNWQDPNYIPVVPQGDPDAEDPNLSGLGTGKIIVEMGSLYVGGPNQPKSSDLLFRLKLDPNGNFPGSTTIGLATNSTRGGVVDINGNAVTPVLTGTTVTLEDCFPCWEPYTAQYAEWVSVFKPLCWCGQYATPQWPVQCYGDADNTGEGALKYRIYNSDYNKLVAAWKKRATQIRGVNWIDGTPLMCADFDHKPHGALKYRVYNSDYDRLVYYWKKRQTYLLPYCPRDDNWGTGVAPP